MFLFRATLLAFAFSLFSLSAHALEFKSVAVTKAILFDAPSSSANKKVLLSLNYPVEVVVNLNDWIKVRDAAGGIYWIEAKNLSTKRTVILKSNTELRQTADANATIVATLEKDLVLDLVEATPTNGWLKVKHRDGLQGYVQVVKVWGIE